MYITHLVAVHSETMTTERDKQAPTGGGAKKMCDREQEPHTDTHTRITYAEGPETKTRTSLSLPRPTSGDSPQGACPPAYGDAVQRFPPGD